MHETLSWQEQGSSWRQQCAGRVSKTEGFESTCGKIFQVLALMVEAGGLQVLGQHGLHHTVSQANNEMKRKEGKRKGKAFVLTWENPFFSETRSLPS